MVKIILTEKFRYCCKERENEEEKERENEEENKIEKERKQFRQAK